MSSVTRYRQGGSSASRYRQAGGSASRYVAAGSSASRYAALGSSASRYVTPGGIVDPEIFRAAMSASALSNLDQALTIEGSTYNANATLLGKDATALAWVGDGDAGLTFAITGSGTDPTPDIGTPLLDNTDKAIKFNDGKTFVGTYADPTSYFNIGTGSMYFEMLMRCAPTAADSSRFFFARSGAGFDIRSAVGNLQVFVYDGSAFATGSVSGAHVANAWQFFSGVWCKTTKTMRLLRNGIVGTDGTNALVADTLNQTGPVQIGINGGAADAFDGAIAYMRFWNIPVLTTHASADLVAQERFQKLVGLWPSLAKGTKYYYGSTGYNTRDSVAYLDKYEAGGEKAYYLVGTGWPRVCHRKDVAATDVKLLLQETAATNLALQSADLATTWAKEDAGDSISANAVAAPNGQTTMDGIIADADDNAHGVSQAVTLTAVAYTFSVFAKKGAKDWIELANSTVANCSAYFNLATGALGTKGAGVSAYGISDWGNGIYRCWIVYTGTVAAHTHLLRPAHADTDNDFAGDGAAVSSYFWGAQVELGSAPSSYIATTTAAATRAYDYLWFKADDGNYRWDKYSISFDALSNVLPAGSNRIMSTSYNSTLPYAQTWLNTNDVAAYSYGASTVGASCNNEVAANTKFSVVWTGQEGTKMAVLVDGTEGAPDTTDVTLAGATQNRINVGRSISTTGQLNGLIGNLVIRKAYDEEAPE